MQTQRTKICKLLYDFALTTIFVLSCWWLTKIFNLEILESLEKITASVWASLIALVGVVFTIQNGNRQRDKDRDMSLRREIYLDAAAAITKWQLLIGSLGNPKLSQEKIDEEFQNISPALAKIDVIATEQTIITASRLKSELLSLYLNLLVKRQPLIMHQIDIDIINNTIQTYETKQKYYFQIMDEINLTPDLSKQTTYSVAQNSADFWTKELDKLYNERNALHIKQTTEIQIFSKLLSDEMKNISNFTTPALVSIRRELGFPINEENYQKTLNHNNTRIHDSLQDFLNKVQKLFINE